MNPMNFDQQFKTLRNEIDSFLDTVLPSEKTPPQRLHQAMRYSALAPGKRIRPLLCMAAVEACGGDPKTVLHTACALECIHAFSLIHDDLPALDNDDLRRGRPTCHKEFGEAMAILAGDALLAFAFYLIAQNRSTATDTAVVQVLRLISQASGTNGMVGGQVADIEAEGEEPTEYLVDMIHARKTGALIMASVVSGGYLADASGDQIDSLRSFGRLIGKAFQVADDVLNATGDEEAMGKPVGSDVRRKKATYVALYGSEGAKRRAEELHQQALACLEPFGSKSKRLRSLAQYAVDRES